MASEEEVVIIARMAGKTAFIRDNAEMAASLEEVGLAADTTGLHMERAGRRGYLMNQALFTMRRLLYASTLAFVATGVAAVRMGFGFNSAMQQARVALEPVSRDIGGVQNRLNSLFNFTKYTPFQFKDVTVAFRQMYLGMRTVGISADTVQATLHSMVDALSATGRTSPGALNRVAVALQHMAYQGHLTGYSVNQLARDGIPIFAALRKELGLTGEQMHTIGTLGIPTQTALAAINKYIEDTPGFANAAYRQATGSLHGLFTTFKDNISQLMGNMETGVFHRFQQRLVAFNAFFGRIANSMQHHASFSTVIGDAFGGRAEFVWKQFAADLSLVWHIFTGFIRDVARSHATWAILVSALVLLHGILLPLNFAIQHMGWAMNIIIPLFVAWIVYSRTMIALERIKRFLLLWNAGETDAYALSTVAMNAALRTSIFLGNLWAGTLSALSVLLTGAALGNAYRPLTLAERAALALRRALITLFAPLAGVVAESWAWTAALLANPITWIVLGVVALTAGLVVLYLKWAPFRKLINDTFGWLWHHPMATYFVPVIGQLVLLAKLFYEVYKHIRDIYNLVRHPLRSFGGGGSGLLHGLEDFGRSFLPFGGHLPHLAGGGVITRPGSVVVGENGPEILRLPAAASVLPLGATGAPSSGGDRQPLQINFVVGQRVLESVMVDIINNRLATV